jgi:hypothetical protein
VRLRREAAVVLPDVLGADLCRVSFLDVLFVARRRRRRTRRREERAREHRDDSEASAIDHERGFYGT